tara:strand:+ start:516 stop:758 length:243 start_codon:yes stop_codon:yes gene_type:complete
MKKGYWISLYSKVENQENLKKYSEAVIPIIKSFGGVPLIRGGKYQTYNGEDLLEQSYGNFQVMKKQLSVTTLQSIKLGGV